MSELEIFRNAAEKIAREVGTKISSYIISGSGIDICFKSRTNLVTNIDYWSEEVIKKELASQFPEHLVIGEESADATLSASKKTLEELTSQGYCWLVDPIDGTTNFINNIPFVGVSLALLIDGKRSVGVIYDVCRDEMFSAIKGEGARLNHQKIQIGAKELLIDSIMALGYPHTSIEEWGAYREAYELLLKKSRAIRRFGSSTLEQCWVACGRLDAVFESYMRPWDVAAGSLILEEAGAIVKNCDAPDNEFSPFCCSFVAANPKLFSEVFKIGQDALDLMVDVDEG